MKDSSFSLRLRTGGTRAQLMNMGVGIGPSIIRISGIEAEKININ